MLIHVTIPGTNRTTKATKNKTEMKGNSTLMLFSIGILAIEHDMYSIDPTGGVTAPIIIAITITIPK